MFPWGHAAVGYLLYAAYQRAAYGLVPREAPVLALAVGTQFPDLIDKPLAYQFAILPSGRSLGHSLLIAILLLAGLWLLADRTEHRSLVGAFGTGYITHLLGDGLYPVLNGNVDSLRYLAYPLVEPILYDAQETSFLTYLIDSLLFVDPQPTVLFEGALTAVALGVWYADGLPGLGLLVRRSGAKTTNQLK